MGKIDSDNETAIETLVELIYKTQNEYSRCHDLLLKNFDETSTVRISNLWKIGEFCSLASESLGAIKYGHKIAVNALVELIHLSQDEYIRDDYSRLEAAEMLGKIDPGNDKAINTITELIQDIESEDWDAFSKGIRIVAQSDLISEALRVLGEIGKGNEKAIAALEEYIQAGWDENGEAAETLGKIDAGNEIAINALLKVILNGEDKDEIAANRLERILEGKQLTKVVKALKHYMTDRVFKDNFYFYEACHDVLWRCAQNMSYSDFYRDWDDQVSPCQALENQFTSIAEQLPRTAKTYPIVINTQALEGETDTSAIAQELCNQIYLAAFPDESEIPEVSNAPQLKRLIPKIKKQLQKQNLALILNKCEPNPALVAFCRKLTDMLHIAWITNESIEPPLQGFLPNQANLLSAIQSWIDELS